MAAKSPATAADVTEEVQIVFMTLLIAVVFADVNAKQIPQATQQSVGSSKFAYLRC